MIKLMKQIALVLAAPTIYLTVVTTVSSVSATQSETDELGWHIVQPGDTLQEVTEQYLGSAELWRENWKLNPGLSDPNMLRVGARLRVILRRQLPQRTAELTQVANRVEQKPQPQPWVEARVGSRLKERDGLRTYESSSAELRFEDDSTLTITEQSLIFLREMQASVGGTNRESIEIIEGQAEVEARPARRGSPEIEILVGGARARPSRVATGVSTTRARKPETGGASVMVYGGETEVSASGTSVSVASGMGTAVPEGGPPSPPERLLDAPRSIAPAASSSWNFANPKFRWADVAGAESYTVEVCSDARCAQLVGKSAQIQATEWAPAELPTGSFYWRVSARAPSGLDGYPSTARPISITSARRDLEPPVVVAMIRGPGEVNQSGTMALGDGSRIELAARDDASGVADIRYRWNDRSWSTYGSSDIAPPDLGPETHRLEVMAVDGWGRESKPWTLAVVRDLSAPAPPSVKVRAKSMR